MTIGIEAIHAYMGAACVDVRTLFDKRGLNIERFDNLMMEQKAVGLPCEDPVTNAVNAAKPIVDALSPEEKNRIEWVVTGGESGLDFESLWPPTFTIFWSFPKPVGSLKSSRRATPEPRGCRWLRARLPRACRLAQKLWSLPRTLMKEP